MVIIKQKIFTTNRVHAYFPLWDPQNTKHVVLAKRTKLLTCGIFAVLSLWSVGSTGRLTFRVFRQRRFDI